MTPRRHSGVPFSCVVASAQACDVISIALCSHSCRGNRGAVDGFFLPLDIEGFTDGAQIGAVFISGDWTGLAGPESLPPQVLALISVSTRHIQHTSIAIFCSLTWFAQREEMFCFCDHFL